MTKYDVTPFCPASPITLAIYCGTAPVSGTHLEMDMHGVLRWVRQYRITAAVIF